MPPVHDLSSDLKGAAAATHSAQVGRPLSANAGDTVASHAAFGLERQGASLLRR